MKTVFLKYILIIIYQILNFLAKKIVFHFSHCKIKRMELVGSSNNILVDYDGDEDEEQMENEEMEEEDFGREEMDDEAKNDENMEQIEEEDEEPDFMDNSGKLWKFECRIENNKHLEDWCRRMGGMRRGKEEKFTRQFECPTEKCQFKVIFLKSVSILYWRNVHNHEVENMEILVENGRKDIADKESNKMLEAAAGEDYVDIFGKVWKFYKQIGKDISHKTLCNKFGFTFVRNRQSTLNLYCRKYGKNWKCKFAGIYLKANGCLYIRGEHEHISKKPPPKVGEDYTDQLGKVWAFNEQIGIGVPQKTFRRKFGFTNIRGMQKMYMCCRRNGPGGRCKFAGIYFKENECLYTRGEHEHGAKS